MTPRAALAGLSLLVANSATALTLEFPAVAIAVADKAAAQDSRFVPTSAFDGDQVDGIVAEGAVRQQAWKVGAGSLTTLQLLAPLRSQLQQAGYELLFECEARACGGFDFRYRLDVLQEPEMHVNLGDYRYLSARKTGDRGDSYVSLVVSRSLNAGFVHLTQIGAFEPGDVLTASTKAPNPSINRPLGASGSSPLGVQLEQQGHVSLDDLTFGTGSSELGSERFASLSALAGYLKDRPEARIVLVGHTDSEGALDSNVALSRKRAEAVATRLTETYGVPAVQVSADGVGFLAPEASNLTEEGRSQNRRVEVILTSTK